MLFWIFVGIFVVALVGFIVCYHLGRDVGADLTAILTGISGIAVVVSIAIMADRYSHADADVAIERKIYYYDQFLLEHTEKRFTGKKQTGFFVQIGALYFCAEPKEKENRDRISETWQIRLTESFYLPLYWGKTQCREYRMVTEKYSKDEAKRLAFAHLAAYEQKLMEKGVQISENNVKINVNGNVCTGSGSLTVIEQAAVKQTAVQQEIPEERTAEDDWQYN